MKFRLSILLCIFVSFTGFCQLTAFSLSATAINETCQGNGRINLQTSGTTEGATITYSLYLLPNTTTPLSQFTENTIGGLTAGNYRVIAVQSLGEESNSQQQDITIVNQVQNLAFEITASTTANCDTTGNLIANVTSGSGPFFYEIIIGPETAPLQISNTFTGLQSGTYTIRVLDNCGNAEVHTYTLVLPSNNITISGAVSPAVATSCSSIDIFNTVTPSEGTNIIYPLQVTYTLHYPDGDQTIVENYNTGPADELGLSKTLPLFDTQSYTYEIHIVDSCNNQFVLNDVINPNPVAIITGNPNECGLEYLTLAVTNFSPPYTINFTGFPAGFDPVAYNAAYPGPFNSVGTDFGTEDHTVPYGTYTAQITDSCGRTSEPVSYEYIDIPLTPEHSKSNATCTVAAGTIRISIPEGRKIVSAFIVSAPAAYTQPLPSDVSSFINATTGILLVTNLPIGAYDIVVTDDCGVVYDTPPTHEEILPFTEQQLTPVVKPGCTANQGSVRLRSGNGALTAASIIAAPPEFTEPLPFVVTSNIVSGLLYMSDLPAGTYEFSGTDTCGITNTRTVEIIGYDPGANNFFVVQNCGSFNLDLHDTSNIIGDSYWLQQFNAADNVWEHPVTGDDYVEGVVPNNTNSIPLINNESLLNQVEIGTYRIIKVYQTFDGGTTNCIQKYEAFDYTGSLDVLSVFSLDCTGGAGDNSVLIDVLGVPPYQFRVLSPTPFENGNSNVFQNLTPELYTFQVEDSCGRLAQVDVNVGTLLPLVTAEDPTPSELLVCGTPGQTNAEFNLTTLNASILGSQPPANYVVTYHLSQSDADQNIGALPETFTNTANPQTIFVRVEHSTVHYCHATTSFRLFVGQTPDLDTTQQDIYVCDGDKTRIFADSGYDSYVWSTGATTPYIDVDTPGDYTVTVKNNYGGSFCSSSETITVKGSSAPVFTGIEPHDWTDNRNSFETFVTGSGNYVYSLDGVNYQTSNTFENLLAGVYTVFIKDLNGCGIIQAEVVLLNYPKFFTPNGDGYNDKWQIKFAVFEPGMQIYIFDRFGKLITGFGADSQGWDGTYNGHPLPSTDYWFKVIRLDGTIYRGHFAMKR